MDETQAQEPHQLAIPFPVDKEECKKFLDRALTLEDEMDRLRTELQELRQEYQELLPLGAVSTAIKVVRARKRRAEHAKEPLAYELQALVETFVREHMDALDAGKKQAAEALAATTIPDMTSTEARRLAGDDLAEAIQRGDVPLTTGEVRH